MNIKHKCKRLMAKVYSTCNNTRYRDLYRTHLFKTVKACSNLSTLPKEGRLKAAVQIKIKKAMSDEAMDRDPDGLTHAADDGTVYHTLYVPFGVQMVPYWHTRLICTLFTALQLQPYRVHFLLPEMPEGHDHLLRLLLITIMMS